MPIPRQQLSMVMLDYGECPEAVIFQLKEPIGVGILLIRITGASEVVPRRISLSRFRPVVIQVLAATSSLALRCPECDTAVPFARAMLPNGPSASDELGSMLS
jgi:hypothetical protein